MKLLTIFTHKAPSRNNKQKKSKFLISCYRFFYNLKPPSTHHVILIFFFFLESKITFSGQPYYPWKICKSLDWNPAPSKNSKANSLNGCGPHTQQNVEEFTTVDDDDDDDDGSISVLIMSGVMWPVRPVHDGDGSDKICVTFKLEKLKFCGEKKFSPFFYVRVGWNNVVRFIIQFSSWKIRGLNWVFVRFLE